MIDKQRIASALSRAAQILINEFSYDGGDPKGVKAYQDDVNHFRSIAAELTEKCGHPGANNKAVAYISRAMADAGFPMASEIMGCKLVVDEAMNDNMVHFPQPDGTCYRVNTQRITSLVRTAKRASSLSASHGLRARSGSTGAML